MFGKLHISLFYWYIGLLVIFLLMKDLGFLLNFRELRFQFLPILLKGTKRLVELINFV